MSTRRPASATDTVVATDAVIPFERGPGVAAEVAPAEIPAHRLSALVAGVRRLAVQRDLLEMSQVASETVAELMGALRVHFYFFHADESLLWTREGAEFADRLALASTAARSGRPVVAQRAAQDPHYCRDIDDPPGRGTERLIAQPIVAAGTTHAVVVVVRPAESPELCRADLALLALWAEQVAPLFHMFHVEDLADELGSEPEAAGNARIYREEALDQLADGAENLSVLVGRMPWWLWHSHFLALIVLVAAGLFLLVPVTEYASGPAFIASTNHRDVVAPRPGVVDAVLVERGDQVAEGQLLATLSAPAERSELRRARAELEQALLARLRDPSDQALEQAVAEAKANERRALVRAEESNIRAPETGRIGDVRITQGRAVDAGQVVVTVADPGEYRPTVLAIVPGRYRPALEPGQPFTFRLDGFPGAEQQLTVTSVSDQVLGAAEIRRIVGPVLADSLAIDAPAVIVSAQLDDPEIIADGRRWTVHEGMSGEGDVVVRRKPILYLLVPELERIIARVF